MDKNPEETSKKFRSLKNRRKWIEMSSNELFRFEATQKNYRMNLIVNSDSKNGIFAIQPGYNEFLSLGSNKSKNRILTIKWTIEYEF